VVSFADGDGWKLDSELRAGMKLYNVYTRGNEIRVADKHNGETCYVGTTPDLACRERYRRMIEIIKEQGI
jgi:hypothetical protein